MEVGFYVLVPVYNVEQYICQCIESVLKQTYPYFKLILVDDGTPDRSGVICDAYAHKDSRIHVIHKKNQGLISARRAAIDYVNENETDDKSFFIFLDSDDSLKPHALQTIAETIQKCKCDMVVYGIEHVYEGKSRGFYDKDPFVGTITDKRELYLRMFGDLKYNPLCRKAIKCSLVENLDYSAYYHINNGEDLLQDIPIYKNCEKVVFIPDVLYNYTTNPNSITHTQTYGRFKATSTVRAEVWRFLESENVYTDSDKQAYIAYCRVCLDELLLIVSCFDTSYQNIRKEFQGIRADAYFSMLLDTVGLKGKQLFLLKHNQYFLLYLACKIKLKVIKLREKLKSTECL